ncbi:MAG: putative quinol monooxygenase [Armatimonadota bacterium]
MVKLIARLKARAGQEELLTDALRKLSTPSRQEAGCLEYVVCRGRDDPATLLVLEEWESQAALDAHMETPHFQAFLAEAGDALEGEPELELLEPI